MGLVKFRINNSQLPFVKNVSMLKGLVKEDIYIFVPKNLQANIKKMFKATIKKKLLTSQADIHQVFTGSLISKILLRE